MFIAVPRCLHMNTFCFCHALLGESVIQLTHVQLTTPIAVRSSAVYTVSVPSYLDSNLRMLVCWPKTPHDAGRRGTCAMAFDQSNKYKTP